ncbi:MAG: MMPL family transporter [Planctomycetota bacterium]
MSAYARFLGRRPWPIVLAVAAATAWLGWWTWHLRIDFSFESLFLSKDAEVAEYEEFTKQFGSDDNAIYVVASFPDAFGPSALEALDVATRRISARTEVSRVFSLASVLRLSKGRAVPPDESQGARWRAEILANPALAGNLVSRDGTTTAVLIETTSAIKEARARGRFFKDLRQIVSETIAPKAERTAYAGIPVIEEEYSHLIANDQKTFPPIAIGVFTVLLLVYFGTIGGVALPLSTVVLAAVWTVGLLTMAGRPIGVLTGIVPTLVLVICIGDSIHFLSRYTEELPLHPTRALAIETTVRTMAFPCLQTSFTNAIGFGTLLTTSLFGVQEFGLLTAVGLVLGYVLAMTYLPAMLALVRPLRRLGGIAGGIERGGSILRWIASVNERHRYAVIVVSLLITVAAGIGMSRLKTRQSWFQDIPESNAVYQDTHFIEERLTGTFTLEVVVTARQPGAFRDPASLKEVERLVAYARGHEAVSHAMSVGDILAEVNRLMHRGDERFRTLPATAKELEMGLKLLSLGGKEWAEWLPRWVDAPWTRTRVSIHVVGADSESMGRLVEDVERYARENLGGFDVEMTGRSVMAGKALQKVVDNMISSVGWGCALIFLMMWLQFRSLTVGLLSMIPNLIPVAITGGIMGFAGFWLNFSTMTIFSISLGIAVNDTIHYLARYREEIVKDGDGVKTMQRVLISTGRTMIFGTALLVAGFASIVTSNFMFTRNFGILGGITMITAMLADLFLTPTLMLVFHAWEAKREPPLPGDGPAV